MFVLHYLKKCCQTAQQIIGGCVTVDVVSRPVMVQVIGDVTVQVISSPVQVIVAHEVDVTHQGGVDVW